MNADRWARLEQIFTEALVRPPADREAYLVGATAGDVALLAEVRAMLAELDAADLRIEGRLARLTRDIGEDPWLGVEVGPYRLERRIGEGGMGLVYLGERIDGAFERSVAVKVLARRVTLPGSQARFEDERRILARLDHPNIARLIDGGSVRGQPYLVMDLVIGDSITTYCDQRELDTAERIRLFRRVCDAVQYAHRNLVVHRDLKPANILVTPLGHPKLLDFGIAKLIEPEQAGDATLTRLLTPEYASPEQITGRPVTTASDVYALGALLYRLLSGESPYGDQSSSLYSLEQAIVEFDPGPPPGVEPDLGLIVEKAMRKDASERYGSAGELSADLGRYLADLPVEARQGTWRYRASKFVRRHTLGVAMGAAAIGVLAAFGAVNAVQAARLETERNAAQVARGESDAVVDVLVSLFEQNSPDLNLGGDTVRLGAFLDEAERSVLAELDERPEVRRRMLEVLGRVSYARQRFDDAERLLAEALASHRASKLVDDSTSAAVLQSLVRARLKTDPTGVQPLAREAVEVHRRLFGPDHRIVGQALQDLATATTDPDQRMAVLEESLAIRQRWADLDSVVSDETRLDLAGGYNALAIHFWRKGDANAAATWFENSLAELRRIVPDDHPYILTVSENLASAYDLMGEYQTAETMLLTVLSARRRLDLGPNAGVATNLNNLASVTAKLGRVEEAVDLAEQSVAEYREAFGDEGTALANALRNLAVYRWHLGERDTARRLLDEVIERQEDVGLEGTLGTRGAISSRTQRGWFLVADGRAQEVLDTVRILRPLAVAAAGEEDSLDGARLAQLAGWALLELARFEEAARELEAAVHFFAETGSRRSSDFLESAGGLGVALAGLGRTDEAREWLDEVVPIYLTHGLADPVRARRMSEAGVAGPDDGHP